MPIVHFNHSGAGLAATETLQTISEHLQREAEYGPMETAAVRAERLDNAYHSVARLLGCTAQQIVFGSGHDQLYDCIISAIPVAAGERLFVSRQEWIGNVLALQQAASLNGATLELMASDSSTAVDVAALRAALTPEVRIVALTWTGASGALINPAAAIGRAIRESGSEAWFIIDASQTVGQLPIDVKEIGCDALVACGRKFLRGPRGTAFAFLSDRLATQIMPSGSNRFPIAGLTEPVMASKGARVLHNGELSGALLLGLACAVEQALALGLSKIRAELNARAAALRHALGALPRVRLLDLGAEKAASVTFIIDGLACTDVKRHLARSGINIGMNGRAYTPYDLDMRGIPELLRASVHVSTTDEEIDTLVNALHTLTAGPRYSAENDHDQN